MCKFADVSPAKNSNDDNETFCSLLDAFQQSYGENEFRICLISMLYSSSSSEQAFKTWCVRDTILIPGVKAAIIEWI